MPTDATFCSNYLTTTAQIMQTGKSAVFISTENVLGECNMTMTANQTLYCTMIKVKEVRENSLHTRRQQQTKPKLFNQIVNKPEHCLHYLLPTAKEQSVTDHLRSANKLPRIFAKTNRFKNFFICYSLTVYSVNDVF